MKPDSPDYNQPVAYDADGRPLYAHPPQMPSPPPSVSYPTKAMPSELKTLHEESVRKYPQLNLSEDEFVIKAIHRHSAGLIPIIGVTIIAVVLIILGGLFFHSQEAPGAPLLSGIMMPALLAAVLVLLLAYAAIVVYQDNTLYITNESVIGETRTTLFAHEEKTVSLGDISQSSYTKNGIFQSFLQYGTIHLLVEGDKAEYNFKYAPTPKEYANLITNEIEKFKAKRG